MSSYLKKKLDEDSFPKAIVAGERLVDLFFRSYHLHSEESIDKFSFYVDSEDDEEYNLCCKISILPKEMLEEQVGLRIAKWDGDCVELVWSRK